MNIFLHSYGFLRIFHPAKVPTKFGSTHVSRPPPLPSKRRNLGSVEALKLEGEKYPQSNFTSGGTGWRYKAGGER